MKIVCVVCFVNTRAHGNNCAAGVRMCVFGSDWTSGEVCKLYGSTELRGSFVIEWITHENCRINSSERKVNNPFVDALSKVDQIIKILRVLAKQCEMTLTHTTL